jgi:hypothetical protein
LATIRKDIHRFRSYSLGEISTPMDYVEKHFDVRLPDTIQLGGVRSCAMAALSILKEYKVVPSNATLIVYVLPDTGVKTWGNTFFLSNKNEGDILYAYLKGDAPWMDCYAGYALSEELLSLYREGKIPEFVERRQLLLQTMESHFIQTVVLSRD